MMWYFKCSFLLLLIFFFPIVQNSQTPFICIDKSYLTLKTETDNFSIAFQVDINQNDISFTPLGDTSQIIINAIGYRNTDNFIYGVKTSSQDIYQIDAMGASSFIGSISNLTNNYTTFISGDITINGKNLVLFGRQQQVDKDIILVDLESPTFQATTLPLIMQPSIPQILQLTLSITYFMLLIKLKEN